MNEDKLRFIDDLQHFVTEVLQNAEGGGDYIRGSVRILDARNGLFRLEPLNVTDEEENCYAVRQLCMLDENMETVADRKRIERVARNYFD